MEWGWYIYIAFSFPTIKYCLITKNILPEATRDTYVGGGGIAIIGPLGGNVNIINCAIVNNFAGDFGGGIYSHIGNICLKNSWILNNKIKNNVRPFPNGGVGAYLYFYEMAGGEFINDSIAENSGEGMVCGGGLIIHNAPPTMPPSFRMRNCKIISNFSPTIFGGGIFVKSRYLTGIDMGTFSAPGYNILMKNYAEGKPNEIYVLSGEPSSLTCIGNYWGSLDTDTIQSHIIIQPPSQFFFDPIAASDKYFSIIYNSRCTTSVIIDGKLSVEKDITLTIKEGRSFYFLNEGSFLLILGNLDAIGQEFLPIKFIPYPYSPIQKWGGIVIDGTGNFEWCEIKKGYNGISGGGGLTGVISVNNSKIESCEVSGLYLKNPYRVEISNSSIADNGVYGIYISSEIIFIPVLWINNNQILRNGRYGIYWEEVNVGATNIIQSNKITGWRDPNDPNTGSLYGIYLTKNPTASIPTV
ncbi:MAG: right-handed parallel beta-helix repeat-containing protein, partial [Candidatus Aenigmatarchaeota archaeon]